MLQRKGNNVSSINREMFQGIYVANDAENPNVVRPSKQEYLGENCIVLDSFTAERLSFFGTGTRCLS